MYAPAALRLVWGSVTGCIAVIVSNPRQKAMQAHIVVEFILWLLIAASVIAVVVARLRGPYTVALVLGGLTLEIVRTPFLQQITGQRPDWLTPDIAMVIFLPPLLFEGSVKIQFRHLRENFIPVLLLANFGLLVATIITGYVITAINCSGSLPPQETGLVTDSWYGKFHLLEMHWLHAAHFVLWGRSQLLEKSLPWYFRILPRARITARLQGYRAARWPKMVGPDGRETPGSINPFIIWQQPHPIYYVELLYQARPNRETLHRYQEIVHETAEFMSSYAWRDTAIRQYFLGPPVVPAQEGYARMRARSESHF